MKRLPKATLAKKKIFKEKKFFSRNYTILIFTSINVRFRALFQFPAFQDKAPPEGNLIS